MSTALRLPALPPLLRHGPQLPGPGHVALGALALFLLSVASSVALRRWREGHGRAVVLDVQAPDGCAFERQDWVVFFRNLYGIAAPWWKRVVLGQPWVSLEFRAGADHLRVLCCVPERLESLLRVHLLTALPGAVVSQREEQPCGLDGHVARSRLRLWRDSLYPLAESRHDALRGVLSALAAAGDGVVQLVVAPDVGWQREAARRLLRLSRGEGSRRGTGSALLRAFLGLAVGALTEVADIFLPGSARSSSPVSPLPGRAAAADRPPSEKAGEPGYRAELRLRLSATSRAEARRRMQTLTSAFRAFDGDNGLRPWRVWLGRRFDRTLEDRAAPRAGMTLTASELASLFHLPVEDARLELAPVRRLPSGHLPATGRLVCLAEDAARTPVVLSQADARHHSHLIGATGAGKSTLLLTSGLDVIEAGDSALFVVDSKGDLVRDLEERIPETHLGRVIVIDPSQGDFPVGLNVLECDDPELSEVVCDSVVTIFRKSYERYWGPRTDDVLRAALLTLLRNGDATLCDVPFLLQQAEGRSAYTGQLDDPVSLGSFWLDFERSSEGQRMQAVGPVLNKLRAFLFHRNVRNMLGQARSTLDIGRAMDERRIVLISLAKGQLGEETSRLLGSFLVARIWQAAMARSRRSEADRTDVNLFLEEFQDYLNLPSSIDDVLAQARGYRLCLTLANQHLGQLTSSTREALSANARTRVVFQVGQEDARYLAREFEPWMTEQQLRNLQRHQVAVRLCVDGRTEPPITGLTRPAPPSLGPEYAALVVRQSAARYGRRRAVVEAEIAARLRASGFDLGAGREAA